MFTFHGELSVIIGHRKNHCPCPMCPVRPVCLCPLSCMSCKHSSQIHEKLKRGFENSYKTKGREVTEGYLEQMEKIVDSLDV
jgi:hypothetical protein